MINNLWYDSFLEMLYKKYPKKSQLIEALMDLLSIERETVYRRLRKDVMFSIEEFIKIASAWNISMDEVIGIDNGKISFKAEFLNYLNPSDQDLSLVKKVLQYFKSLNNLPELEYMEVCNRLPRGLVSGFPYIGRYQLFKWAYQYSFSDEKNLSYSQSIFSSKMHDLVYEYYGIIKDVANTIYIWDSELFNYLVRDIGYFCSIYLITDEEKEFIKKDLNRLLDYMSKVAINGCWPETENKVELYISYINIDTNYSYYYSKEFKECRIHAFMKNEVYSDNPLLVEKFKNNMQAKKRSSVQISKADDRRRIEFFMKQRQLIDDL